MSRLALCLSSCQMIQSKMTEDGMGRALSHDFNLAISAGAIYIHANANERHGTDRPDLHPAACICSDTLLICQLI